MSKYEIVERPWGTYENLLDSQLCKVKKIVVKPNENPSYQMHNKRAEIWVVVSGTGKVRLNDEIIEVKPNDSVFIPVGSKHTMINDTSQPLIFIEVQTGTYFGEDDIVRLEDKYGRV